MPEDEITEISEMINTQFVLMAALYFRLVALDPTVRMVVPNDLHGTLHDIARDIVVLVEDREKETAHLREQLHIGMCDAISGLKEVALRAKEIGQTDLADTLTRQVNRLISTQQRM